jgi:cytochrome c oxidase cbb3-type subunit 3/ubiquinol-cytochrome c reductase cytochrome c subunit
MKISALAGCVLLLAVAGCSHLPGAPQPGIEVPRPDSVTNFAVLYKQNCAGCHGDHGKNGAALDLANPVYLSWIDDASLRKVIGNGETDVQMPAFAKSAGGFLTDAQIDALVHGMRTAWPYKLDKLQGPTPPPYTTALKGDAAHGAQVYQQACARCHQSAAQSITSPTYLALVNDQSLRALIVAGRPDIGQPDWQGDIAGHPLTDQQVTDLVAWLAAQRTMTPGQPYSQLH